mgnify:CR=1 FL=1
MEYRCVATSLEGFIQQLAVAYIAHGYYFYVSGFLPEGKNPETIDQKLLDKYGVRLSKFARYRRKALGQASIQYLRFERFFVLIATHGKHLFFLDDAARAVDVAVVEQPLLLVDEQLALIAGRIRIFAQDATVSSVYLLFLIVRADFNGAVQHHP